MMDDDTTRFELWLAEGGLQNRPLPEMFDGFTAHLLANGVDLQRAYMGMSTRHPLIRAFDMTWEPSGRRNETAFDHSWPRSTAWTESPLRHMILTSQKRMHRVLQGPAAVLDFPMFHELSERGLTAWYGAISPFEAKSILETPGALGMACSWATGNPAGFDPRHLALIDRLFPKFAVAVKAAVMPSITRTLLGAYIGADAAERVWSGATSRGSIERVEAAIFVSDLRGFTAFAERADHAAVMTLLNRYFDVVGAAIEAEGGHILKFMGDGVLATFAETSAESSEANVCERALRAARAANRAVLAAQDGGDPEMPRLDLGIALHKGEVMYGNVGTTGRLDFTMIGPAVNEAARMEKLTKALGCAILASDSFHAALEGSRALLESAGEHPISGLSVRRSLYRVLAD